MVAKLEQAFPNRSPSEILVSLTFHAGVNNEFFQKLAGIPKPKTIRSKPEKFTSGDVKALQDMTRHISKIQHSGNLLDMDGREFTVSHLLIGIATKKFGGTAGRPVDSSLPLPDLFPLLAVTLAGDLGQHVVRDLAAPFGIDTDASKPELRGDVFGLDMEFQENVLLSSQLLDYFTNHADMAFSRLPNTLAVIPDLAEETRNFVQWYKLGTERQASTTTDDIAVKAVIERFYDFAAQEWKSEEERSRSR